MQPQPTAERMHPYVWLGAPPGHDWELKQTHCCLQGWKHREIIHKNEKIFFAGKNLLATYLQCRPFIEFLAKSQFHTSPDSWIILTQWTHVSDLFQQGKESVVCQSLNSRQKTGAIVQESGEIGPWTVLYKYMYHSSKGLTGSCHIHIQ